MKAPEDLTGRVFGKRKVVSRAENKLMPNGRSIVYWNVICECGELMEVSGDNLKRKSVTPNSRCLTCMNITHKYSRPKTPAYTSWTSMRTRCLNKKAREYVNYGGRGISICETWSDFLVFLNDMGERPLNTSLERIDNNKGYSPTNCKWATRAEQQRNTRIVKLTKELVMYIRNSPTKSKDLAIELDIAYSTVRNVRSFNSWKEL